MVQIPKPANRLASYAKNMPIYDHSYWHNMPILDHIYWHNMPMAPFWHKKPASGTFLGMEKLPLPANWQVLAAIVLSNQVRTEQSLILFQNRDLM